MVGPGNKPSGSFLVFPASQAAIAQIINRIVQQPRSDGGQCCPCILYCPTWKLQP
jgi:hypothetical protein